MNGLLLGLLAIGIAVFLSGTLFERRGDQSITVSAVTGLTSNVIWSAAAVFLILGGSGVGAQALIGVLWLTLMLYLARGNLQLLRESEVRAKIAGQT
ncbi:hypothetical protein [Natrialba asiatica]|uniref:Uncharacterized protein n=1 Tax=Natrialba asiatica (strain ATCC 700177 / DSM 12278 / JCM 9576 / FERM P-10747 / NBRC 102637 / 172P1) TaxID=29540 RepID=M0AGY0_NATA1|nr:hypothetical protein [Natrialba asiatica]ELY97152.1 hypothetical protein C481_21226 [Natrialba asiatica DSM 12278]